MKKSPPLTYTFENPNTPSVLEEALKRILVEKLLAEFARPGSYTLQSKQSHENEKHV